MSKKEFLNELENRLAILDEKEIKDIINEYRDIIEEKVKAGATEIEAVQAFGSIDELCREILIAYKVNPKYAESKQKNNSTKSFEGWIKDAASELSRFVKEVGKNANYKGKTFSLELCFEIFIKIFVLLIILAALRIPFSIIGSIGGGIFTLSSSPIDFVFTILWWLLSAVVYLGIAIFVFWVLFKEYITAFDFPETNEVSEKQVNKTSKKKEVVKQEKIVEDVKVVNEKAPIFNSLLVVVRILVTICFLVPLWLSQAALGFVLIMSIYYVVTGINILGFSILLLGLLIGLSALSDLIYNLTFNIKKLKIYSIIPMIISVPIMMAGGCVFAYNILSFDYINEAPSYISYNTSEKNFYLDSNKSLDFKDDCLIQYEVDDTYALDEIKVVVKYPDIISKVSEVRLYEKNSSYLVNLGEIKYISLKSFKNLYDSFIKDLKEGKIYNYNKLSDPLVIVVGNQQTITRIQKDNR